MDNKIKEMKKESRLLEPAIIIGKNGINDEIINNIKKRLEKDRLIKIRILATYISDKDKKQTAKDLAEKCNAILVDMVGFMVVLAKK